MRTTDHSFARSTVLVLLLALILGLAQAGAAGGAASSTPVLHASFAIPAAAAAAQDAAPPAAKPAQPIIKVELPDGEGKPIATEYCQDCHRLTNLTKSHKSKDDWAETVQTMMDRGARIPQENVDTLVQYLAKNFPPKTDAPAAEAQAAPAAAPPAAAPPTDASAPAPASSTSAQAKKVVLPDGDGKAIAEENCQVCHRLTNLTKAHKSLDEWHDTVQLMIDRGANVQPDQMDTLIHYLAKNFGPLPDGAPAPASDDAAKPAAPPSN